MRSLPFVLLLLLSSVARASGLPDFVAGARDSFRIMNCLADVEAKLEGRRAELDAFYRKNFRAPLKGLAGPELLRGDRGDEAVVLVHGFMTSGQEMHALAVELNKQGYTVLAPTLPGFGSSAEAANGSKLAAWRREVAASVELLGGCYGRVILGGLSLGGALAADYVLNGDAARGLRVSALLLFSPYFDISSYVAKPVAYVMKMFSDKIALSTLKSLSGTPDLAAVMNHPEYANTEMPIGALAEVFALSASLKATPAEARSPVPTALFYSGADATVDLALADRFTRAHFPVHEIFAYDRGVKIPHQITSPEVNAQFGQLVENVGRFLGAR